MAKVTYLRAEDRLAAKIKRLLPKMKTGHWYLVYCLICAIDTAIAIHKV